MRKIEGKKWIRNEKGDDGKHVEVKRKIKKGRKNEIRGRRQ